MSTSATAGQAGTSGASLAILIGRILLAAMFVLAGFGKLTDIGGTAGWFGSIGLPAPTIVAVLVGLLELVAGLAIVVGFQTRIAALLVAVNMLFAIGLAHRAELFALNAGGGWAIELQGMFLFTAIAIALLGAGRFSLDKK